jgi:hypothetical protein
MYKNANWDETVFDDTLIHMYVTMSSVNLKYWTDPYN